MTTKAYVIATALVALMTLGIIALVASPVLSIKMDVTARGQDGGQRAGNGGPGGVAGHGGYGGDTSVDNMGKYGNGIRNDDGHSSRHGGNGGLGGDANGGRGGNTPNGADETVISIDKTY
ncbi:MAG TPA: hypothetical protein VH500_09905 [Nitrososphaeraceae archaeon]